MPTHMTDKKGKTLPTSRVEEIALDNIIHSMSLEELASLYMQGITSSELLEWATDADGNFSARALGEDD